MDPAYDVPKWPAKPKVSPPSPVQGTSITILGCGTSTGVPLLACDCATCTSQDPKNRRLRASVVIQTRNRTFLIDTSPDLREQGLRHKLFWVDAVLFTHPHADHIHGIDELRSYNYLMARRIDCYGNEWTIKELRKKFDYIFKKTQEGGGKPRIDLNLIDRARMIAGVKVVPLKVIHGKLPVLGYRINDVAYITDTSEVPDRTIAQLKGLDVLVLDCLRQAAHTTHLNVDQAIAIAKRVDAKKTVFTHMGHDIDYHAFARSLPPGMEPAYDGMTLLSSKE